jgi:hypothetical protein
MQGGWWVYTLIGSAGGHVAMTEGGVHVFMLMCERNRGTGGLVQLHIMVAYYSRMVMMQASCSSGWGLGMGSRVICLILSLLVCACMSSVLMRSIQVGGCVTALM